MDFVVSKVVMSICALVVAGGLAEVVGSSLSAGPGEDLERVLAGLQGTVSGLAVHGGDCAVAWPVPALPSGEAVHMSFRDGMVTASAGGSTRAAATVPEVHAWAWDGGPLNSTSVDALDASCGRFDASTGDTLTLSVVGVPVGDCTERLVFVS